MAGKHHTRSAMGAPSSRCAKVKDDTMPAVAMTTADRCPPLLTWLTPGVSGLLCRLSPPARLKIQPRRCKKKIIKVKRRHNLTRRRGGQWTPGSTPRSKNTTSLRSSGGKWFQSLQQQTLKVIRGNEVKYIKGSGPVAMWRLAQSGLTTVREVKDLTLVLFNVPVRRSSINAAALNQHTAK